MTHLILEKETNSPKGWIRCSIKDLIKPSKERFNPIGNKNKIFLGLEHIEKNTRKILGKSNTKHIRSTKTIFRSGDVLYGRLRPYLNKVCVPDFNGVCSTDILVFQKQPLVNSHLLTLFLSTNSFVTYANANTAGMQHPRISFDKISSFPFPLPPLNEQKRIVSKIESIFTKIDAAKERLETLALQTKSTSDSLSMLKSSILKQAFEGKLVPQDHDDEPAEILLKKICKDSKGELVEGNRLPKGWIRYKIKNIITLTNGRAFKPEDWSTKGIPIVRIQNLNDATKPYNYCNFKIHKKFLIEKNALLFAWSGSFGAFIWNHGKAVLNQHIFKIEADWNHLDKHYIKYALNQNLDEYIHKSHGVGLVHITKGTFENSLILLPPLNEQKRIVAKIESIFDRIDAIFYCPCRNRIITLLIYGSLF